MLALDIEPPECQKSQGLSAEQRRVSSLLLGQADRCCSTPILTGSELNHLWLSAALCLPLTLLPAAIPVPKDAHPVPAAQG